MLSIVDEDERKRSFLILSLHFVRTCTHYLCRFAVNENVTCEMFDKLPQNINQLRFFQKRQKWFSNLSIWSKSSVFWSHFLHSFWCICILYLYTQNRCNRVKHTPMSKSVAVHNFIQLPILTLEHNLPGYIDFGVYADRLSFTITMHDQITCVYVVAE